MTKFWLSAVITLFSALLSAEARGRLELAGTNVVAFGEYPNTEDRTAVVAVRNVGEAPLSLSRVFVTCKCMRVVSFPKTLGPGESGEVSVMIAKNEVAGWYERVFFIESDDAEVRSVKVRITGFARPLFLVTCDRPFALGPVDAGTVWTGRFTVAATEKGIRLGAPEESNLGASGSFVISTNVLPTLTYVVDRKVTFDGEGLLESALVFPVLRDDGLKSLPVRVTVEAVRRRPFRVVPDRLVVVPGAATVKRRLLVSVDSPVALDATRLTWVSEPEAIDVRVSLSKSGKAFQIDLYLTPDRLEQLVSAGQGSLRLSYGGGFLADVPIALGR